MSIALVSNPRRRVVVTAVVLLVLAAAGCSPARARRGRDAPTVAVFTFLADAGAAAEQGILEEAVRSAAGRHLGRAGYRVLANEVQLEILEDTGLSPEQIDAACREECALDMAKGIRARHFITGRLVADDGGVRLVLRLFDAVTGRLLAVTDASARSGAQLRRDIEEGSCEFFRTAMEALGDELECEPDPRRETATSPDAATELPGKTYASIAILGIAEGLFGLSASWFPHPAFGVSAGAGVGAVATSLTLRHPRSGLYVSGGVGRSWGIWNPAPFYGFSGGFWQLGGLRLGGAIYEIEGQSVRALDVALTLEL